MTRNQYILLFIVLAVATIVVFLIIYYVEVEENKGMPFIETCGSFPNDGVYVPAAFYKLQYRGGYTGSGGSKVTTEKKCNENCKNIGSCAGYLYNSGTCYLLDADEIKQATYYCKHGTGLTVTPNFAKQYRRQMAEPITGYGYFKEDILPKSAIVKAPAAWEECVTLRQKTSDVFKTGMAAEKIWTDKSYKIPELKDLDFHNYDEGAPCTSYCSSMGGYQMPWCYTHIDLVPVPGSNDKKINNKTSRWGFCTNGCLGFDCFEGAQTPFTPQAIKNPSTNESNPCTNCVHIENATTQCGSCQGCLDPDKPTCPENAPATWSPTQRANYYCLYPGSDQEYQCCAETNLCASIINPPTSYSQGIVDVPGESYRKKHIDMVPDQSGSPATIEIPYLYQDPQKILGTCISEANCKLSTLSPGNYWCGPPAPLFADNPIVIGINNPHQTIDGDYGKCTSPANELLIEHKCCTYQLDNRWAPSAAPTGIDSYWVTTKGPLVPESDIARSCRTECTDLNPSDPPSPLSARWCITDSYFPSATLAGSPISFPIIDPNFTTQGSQIDRTFWQFGWCDPLTCSNSLSWPPASNVTKNNYPQLTGQ